jgi:enoyl-CoA hydratase/carnithine racemase
MASYVQITPPGPDGIARLAFVSGRPANVLHRDVVDEMLAAVRALAERVDIRVLIIEGAPGAFCGGADLLSLGEISAEEFDDYVRAEMTLFDEVDELAFITLAVLDGPCIGNGAELALACDLRVMSDRGAFGFPETRVGFGGPALRITRYVGIGQAKRMLYEGLVIGAAAAEDLGLVGWVSSAEDLAATVNEVADRYGALPPRALSLTKQTLNEVVRPSDAAREHDLAMAMATFRTQDSVEGRTAFLAHREPRFHGI